MKSLTILFVLLVCSVAIWAQQPTYDLRKRIVFPNGSAANQNVAANRQLTSVWTADSSLALRTRDAKVKAMADSSRFVANRTGDWSMYNAYVSAAKETISLEAIVSHSRDADWSQYQRFGRITDKKLLPAQTTEVKFHLLTDVYDVKVDEEGWCYIKLAEGQLPQNDPVVIPISITFKGK